MNLSVKIKDLVLIMLMIFGLQSCSTQKNNANPTPEPVKTVEIALEKPKNKENCFKNAADRRRTLFATSEKQNCSNSCQSNEFISR